MPGAFRSTLLGVIALVLTSSTLAQEPPKSSDHQADTGRYFGLIIGIDQYHGHIPKLQTAVADATAISEVLRNRFGFTTKTLLNEDASRANILRAIADYRTTLNENDSLLIYYAGHGLLDKSADKAYWIPVDAETVDSPNRIIADDITSGVRVLPARHVLVISDSCYSGGLSREVFATEAPEGSSAFLARMIKGKSRTLMSSGGDEPVADGGSEGHSVFAHSLIRALSQINQMRFTASDLFYRSIQQDVAGNSGQLPEYVPLRNSGHTEGDFVFVRRSPPVRTAALDPAIDPIHFGIHPNALVNLFPSLPASDWPGMGVADEFLSTQVRFFYLPTAAFSPPDSPGSPFRSFAAFRPCWGRQSYLTFLFAHDELIRISLRLLETCPNREVLLNSWAEQFQMPLIDATAPLRYRKIYPNLVAEGHVMTRASVVAVDLFAPKSPSPYDLWWGGGDMH